MMLPSINMMSATADSTAVKSDELQRSTTSISDTTPTDIEDIPSDTIPVLSKRELRRQRVARRIGVELFEERIFSRRFEQQFRAQFQT